MSDYEFKPHILIVDDNITNIDVLVNTLEDQYSIGIAKNGEQALSYASKKHPHLILLDIMMPGMDGFEVCEHLKASDYTKDISVIFITAVHDAESKTRGFEVGGVDYITKPFNAAEVKARVRTHLDLIGYRDHLEKLVSQRTGQLDEANRELVRMQIQLVQRLGIAGEYKDIETGKHVVRVGLYSGIIAETLGLDRKVVELIRMSSPLHDLGKIGIPDKILLKPGPLNSEEWDLMKEHSNIGKDILMPSTAGFVENTKKYPDKSGENKPELLEVATNIAVCHHERWDGTGYPLGLKGEEIPIEARIVSAADIYDALSNKRPYKEPYSDEKCFSIIRKMSGKELDPGVVNAFFKSIDKVIMVKEDLRD